MANKKKRGHRPKLKKKGTSSPPSPANGAPPPSPPHSASQHLPRNPGRQSQLNCYHHHHQARAGPLTDAEIYQLFANAGIDTSPRKMARLRRIPGLGLPDPPPSRPPRPTRAMKRNHTRHNVEELCNTLANFCATADDVDARVGIQMEAPGPSGAELILWKQAQGTTADTKTDQEVAEEQRVEEAYDQIQQEKDSAATDTTTANSQNQQASASLEGIDRMIANTKRVVAGQPPHERITREDVAEWGKYAPFYARDDYLATFYRDPARTAEDVMQNFEVTRMRLMHLDRSTGMAMELLERRNAEVAGAIEELRALRLGQDEGEGSGSNEAVSRSHREAPADGLPAEVSSAADDSSYSQAEAADEPIDGKEM